MKWYVDTVMATPSRARMVWRESLMRLGYLLLGYNSATKQLPKPLPRPDLLISPPA